MPYRREEFQALYEQYNIARTYKVSFERFLHDLITVMRALEGQGNLGLDRLVLSLKSTYDYDIIKKHHSK